MVGVPRLTDDERQVRDERIRAWHKDYNARPKVITRRKEYYKEYSKSEYAKESHRLAQQQYRRTAKGKACDDRYWKKRNSKGRDNKEGNNDYPGISVRS